MSFTASRVFRGYEAPQAPAKSASSVAAALASASTKASKVVAKLKKASDSALPKAPSGPLGIHKILSLIMAGRETRGRQSIEMKQIENDDKRFITFSKRRSGIYKNASELATLCGVEVGVVLLSPTEKPFSFAHPSIDAIANRFLKQNPPPNDRPRALVNSYHHVRINELNQQHDELINQIKIEEARGKVLKRLTEGKGDEAWWEAPIEESNLDDLNQMMVRMKDLQQSLWRSINQRTREEASTSFQGQSSMLEK
ncbi:agamous-like MADS-box protein AGL29 [Rhodamnia argentea]|uniref:Agamous-like MADS-box protein AGL29 n=1 Tax=Rhodamnia argentea TaxID=178133 RepID=A0ABM3H6D7_9MYRT|nr:agamous-like MADS-box protein AGL29 [Rhodamnia argentea]